MTIQKKVIAREWLILLSFFIVGSLFTLVAYFQVPSDYLEVRKRLYCELKAKRIFNPSNAELYDYRKQPDDNRIQINYLSPPVDIFDTFIPDMDSSIHIGTFKGFSAILDNSQKRKTFYDSISLKYDIGDYDIFESHIISPSTFAGYSKFVNHLFSKWYWFNTWFSVLFPYLIFQILRSIYYSIKILRK